ncbi:hypothetical protein VTL71DRAFT_8553 [Oculimacula yallundae]|uniref:PPM-type phosphatase domain-containing protein n=1 Tax=Oculimacula yallundae TaxID=86028 RepID=A0ABR4CXY8_9HELO
MTSIRASHAIISRSQTRRYQSTFHAVQTSHNTYKYFLPVVSILGLAGAWWATNSAESPPHLGSIPAEHLIASRGPSKEEVTRMISQEAYTFKSRLGGVTRYDGTRVASNSPSEDRFVHGSFSSPWKDGKKCMAWGVFDGHAGWQTADLLQKQLLPFVWHRLSQVKPNSEQDAVSDEDVGTAITEAFVKLDDSIFKTAIDASQGNLPLQDKLVNMAPAFAGSCALLSIYDPAACKLHTACTGDSRAVLGQQNSKGVWEAIPLSIDQTGYNEAEIARLNQAHPGEKDIIVGGRVLGMMISRAFGDSRWKWSVEIQKDLKKRFGGPSNLNPKYKVLTPPYLTAEPVVTSTRIDPGKPAFLIMATDGLWDNLSSQQAVDLVAKWLDTPKESRKENARASEKKYEPYDFSGPESNELFKKEKTIVQDGNAAVHLVRNSLGGNHHEMIAGRLAYGSPFSRDVRDDVTVQVVFFNVLNN